MYAIYVISARCYARRNNNVEIIIDENNILLEITYAHAREFISTPHSRLDAIVIFLDSRGFSNTGWF